MTFIEAIKAMQDGNACMRNSTVYKIENDVMFYLNCDKWEKDFCLSIKDFTGNDWKVYEGIINIYVGEYLYDIYNDMFMIVLDKLENKWIYVMTEKGNTEHFYYARKDLDRLREANIVDNYLSYFQNHIREAAKIYRGSIKK